MKLFLLPIFILLMCTRLYASPQVKLGTDLSSSGLGEIESLAESEYNISLKELIADIISGKFAVSEIADKSLSLLLGEVRQNSDLMRKILLLCVLDGIIAAAAEGYGNSDKIIGFAFFAAAASMLTAGFGACIELLTDGTNKIAELIESSAPLIVSLVTASDGSMAALGYSGILALLITALSRFIAGVIVPQLTLGITLGMLNCLWERKMLGKLSELLKFLACWETRICAFVFVGFISFNRFGVVPASASINKGLKLAVGAVPVVGGLFENSLETVSEFISVLKGGVGAAIIIIVCIAAGVQLIKLCAVMLMYKLTAALSEPIGSTQITDMTDCIGEGIKLVIGIYFTVALMFVIGVAVMLGSFG